MKRSVPVALTSFSTTSFSATSATSADLFILGLISETLVDTTQPSNVSEIKPRMKRSADVAEVAEKEVVEKVVMPYDFTTFFYCNFTCYICTCRLNFFLHYFFLCHKKIYHRKKLLKRKLRELKLTQLNQVTSQKLNQALLLCPTISLPSSTVTLLVTSVPVALTSFSTTSFK
jgi:hypothetical protein